MSAPAWDPRVRRWLVEQHIDIPELTGRWLRCERYATEALAETAAAHYRSTASERETFRVRDLAPPERWEGAA